MSSTPHGCAHHQEEDMAKIWISTDLWIESNGWSKWLLVWKEKKKPEEEVYEWNSQNKHKVKDF